MTNENVLVSLMAMLVVILVVLERSMGVLGLGKQMIRLSDWAVGKGLRLMNTCFQKSKRWLITFR